jgi:ABC-2 type transport system permease protein
MTKTLEVFRFEVRYQFRRASTLVFFLIILTISVLQMQAVYGSARDDGFYFNAPFVGMILTVLGSMMSLLFIAAVAGDAAARDGEMRMDSLFYTSRVGKRAYFAGRFLGTFAVVAVLLLAFPVAFLIATHMPWIDAETLGSFPLSRYFSPWFLFALPNAFIATAMLYAVAAVTRRAITSYLAAGLLFFGTIIGERLWASSLGWSVVKLLDPFGYTILQAFWRSLNALQKNTFVLRLDSTLLANRLIWVGVAMAVLALAYARFRFAYAHGMAGRGSTSRKVSAEVEHTLVERKTIAVPAARRVFDRATRLRQLRAISMHSFRQLLTSRAWWIVPFVALYFIVSAPQEVRMNMGLPGAVTTARLAEILFSEAVPLVLTLLIALSAGELVWRERDERMHAIAGATPVPESLSLTGKFLGLAMMLAAALVVFLLVGLMMQTMLGADRYELLLWLRILFGLKLPEFLLIAALAMVVQVLVNQKYVAVAVVVLVPVAWEILRTIGFEHNLLMYGSLPGWSYSEMGGFGRLLPRLSFMAYFAGWALLFVLLAYLFQVRGEEGGLKARAALARRRLTRGPAVLGAISLAIVAGAGTWIFHNTITLNDRWGAATRESNRAEFERRYGRYASIPQPRRAATKLHVDFHPRRNAATIRGSYRLENRSGAGIESIHVVTHPGVQTNAVSFDRGSRVTLTDDELGYRIYALDRTLQPGESLRMDFRIAYEALGFSNQGSNHAVVRNGSWIQNRAGRIHEDRQWLPFIGYQTPRELDLPADRKKYGLRERPRYPLLDDVARRNGGRELIELETIIGTDAEQVGVAPGELLRTWMENGRRYAHYRTGAPVSNSYAILSAKYAVHRAKWRDVAIEIFHHPGHTANLKRMVRSVQASLEYNTKHFGAYPHRQLRFVEYPAPPQQGLGMSAFAGLVTYMEGFSLARPEDDPRDIDFPFAVVSHEVGHQWWGHQLSPAPVEGAPFLAESLAWYSGMLVVEETFGRDHLRRLLDMLRADYLAPNMPRERPLLRTVDDLDGYRRGPFAMYALREAAGVETVNRTLRKLLAKFPPDRPPYPTTLDFYAELRAATPPSMHSLLKDLFEEITFWELSATRLEVKSADARTHQVTLHVDARKLKGDATGTERPVPMNDAIEIAFYGADGRSIYHGRHRLRSGAQSIEVTLAHPPVRAVVDPDHEMLDRQPEDNEVSAGSPR